MKVKLLAALAVLALAVHQSMIWLYAPVAQSGVVQKIFYMHLPCSWWALVSFFVVFVSSILFLFGRRDVFDRVSGAAAELGVLFASLALVTGSIWARAEWGHWWLWDPKLTTAPIMWYVYAGYLVLRGHAHGPGPQGPGLRRARHRRLPGCAPGLFRGQAVGQRPSRRAGAQGFGHGASHVAHRVSRGWSPSGSSGAPCCWPVSGNSPARRSWKRGSSGTRNNNKEMI